MKLGIIVNNSTALQTLSNIKLKDAQTAWDLADELEAAQKSVQKFNEKRDELVKTYGSEAKDKPGQYQINDIAAFEKDVNGMLQVDVKTGFPVLTLEMLNGSELSANDVMGLRALGIFKTKTKDHAKKEDEKNT